MVFSPVFFKVCVFELNNCYKIFLEITFLPHAFQNCASVLRKQYMIINKTVVSK